MTVDWKYSFISAVVTSLICVAAHVLYSSFLGKAPEFKSGARKLAYHLSVSLKIWAIFAVFMIFSGVLLRGIIVSGSIPPGEFLRDKKLLVLYSLALFFSFFFIYLTFYYILDRSVSSRMMMEIETSPGKKLTVKEMKERYGIDQKYSINLEGMMQGKFIKKDDSGKFFCTAKGAFVANVSSFFKKALKLGVGG
jgi:hypothetical protein